MDIKKLQATVIDALEDIKAQDIVLFDTTKLTSLFDRMVIASGSSNRQTKALAASVRDKIKEAGGTIVGMEGQDSGEWVLVDLGDMIVHIMQPAIRAYYHLEDIWGGKPIDIRSAKRAAKPVAAKKTAARKTAAKTEKTDTKPAAPKKTAAKKAVAKKTTTGKTAAGKSPAKKVATKKSVAKSAAQPEKPKAVAKRTTAKKKTEE